MKSPRLTKSQSLSDPQEKNELDLQEDDLIDLLAVQHEELTNEDLMDLEAQRRDEEEESNFQEEEATEEPERFTMQEMARGLHVRRHC